MPASTGSGHQIIVASLSCGSSATCGSGSLPATVTPTSGASDTFIGSPGTGTPPSACTAVNTNGEKLCIWYVASSGVGTTFTVTCASTCFYLGVNASEWTGGATASPFDVDAFGFSAAATSFTCSGGSTTNATDLFYGFISGGSNLNFTAGSGFLEIGEDAIGYENEAKSVTTTQTLSTTWTSASQTAEYSCAAIKAAGGGATCNNRIALLGAGCS